MATYMPASQLNAMIGAAFPSATTTYTDWNNPVPNTAGANVIAGFTRQATTWTSATGGTEHNSAQLTFATAPTATLKGFSEWSTATGGTYLGGGPTTATVIVATGTTVVVAPGGITLKVTG